jgi:hypothetical protein
MLIDLESTNCRTGFTKLTTQHKYQIPGLDALIGQSTNNSGKISSLFLIIIKIN